MATEREPIDTTPAAEFDRRIAPLSEEALWIEYYAPASPARRRRQERLEQALEARPGERILDGGCGAGALAFWAASRGAWVLGVDYSAASLGAAARIARRLGGAAPAYVRADLRRLPVHDGQFDTVVSIDVLDVLPRALHPVVLGEYRRALRPGGRILLYTPNGRRERIGRLIRPLRRRLGAWAHPDCPLHVGLTGPRRLRWLLDRLGLEGRVEYADMNYPGLAALPGLRAWLAGHMLWTIRERPPA
jgi:SAM-dependent methyltransferase